MQPKRDYLFLHRPCSITTDDQLWCVAGQTPNGGGILCWCYDRDDAEYCYNMLKDDPYYSNLNFHKYQEDTIRANLAADIAESQPPEEE